jgi:hypothetical protein
MRATSAAMGATAVAAAAHYLMMFARWRALKMRNSNALSAAVVVTSAVRQMISKIVPLAPHVQSQRRIEVWVRVDKWQARASTLTCWMISKTN